MADTVLNTTVFDGDKKLITHYNVVSETSTILVVLPVESETTL